MSHSTGGKPFKHTRTFPEKGHDWFDPSSDWRKIIAGTPDLTGKDYKSTPVAVTPSNVIWGKSYDYEKIRYLDDLKTAEYFGFKHPPKREAPRPHYRDFGKPVAKPVGLPAGAVEAAINQMNQIHMQQAPNDAWHAPNGAWAQVHDGAVAHQPFVHAEDEAFPEPDFDEFPDYDEDDLNDD